RLLDCRRGPRVIAFAVRPKARRPELDDQRVDKLAHRKESGLQLIPDVVDVRGVYPLIPDAESIAAGLDCAGHLDLGGRRLGYAIILDYHHKRKTPQLRHVKRLVDGPLPPGA